MVPVVGSRYTIRHESAAPTVPCPCGQSTRILTKQDGTPCSFHVTEIFNADRHYHAKTEEVYYILTGTGQIELDGDWHEVYPGTTIHIPSGCPHRLRSEQGIRTIVVAIPPFDPADEFLLPE
jgi:mannose-6-phosphate isomerase-like protein (cupin superfamily)